MSDHERLMRIVLVFLTLFLLTVLSLGCGPMGNANLETTPGGVRVLREANTHDEYPLEAIDMAFEVASDFAGWSADPTIIAVGIRLSRHVRGWENVDGVYQGSTRTIEIAALAREEITRVRPVWESALVHEWVHFLLDERYHNADPGHTDPLWEMVPEMNFSLMEWMQGAAND